MDQDDDKGHSGRKKMGCKVQSDLYLDNKTLKYLVW